MTFSKGHATCGVRLCPREAALPLPEYWTEFKLVAPNAVAAFCKTAFASWADAVAASSKNVVMADKDQNGGMVPLRHEDKESSELEEVHLQSMSLMPLTTLVSEKQQFLAFPGPGHSGDELYQEDGGKGLLGQHL